MKKFKDNYKEQFLNNLEAKNSLNIIKNELNFNGINKVKKPKRKIILISSLSTALVAVAVIIICVFALRGGTIKGIIPTYKGMNFVSEADVMHATSKLDTSETYDVDTSEIISDMPQGTEYPNITYFAKPNEEVLIAIHLDNPDQYEILSLTLNGYKYQSYQFMDGSDSYTIYIKVKASGVSGVESFYIDQIKYIDETTINVSNSEGKDVRYDGERTIYLGVSYLNLPVLNVSKEQITLSSYLLDFSILDSDGLITNNTVFRAYLLEAGKIIDKVDLTSESRTFIFENLKLNTNYQVVVACSLDLLDGKGYQLISLYQTEFKTASGISDIIVEASYDSLKITPILATDVTLVKGTLLLDDKVYAEVSGSDLEFKNLLADNNYQLELSYSYEVAGETYYDTITFTKPELKTKAYETPTYQNDAAVLISGNMLNWFINITDLDEVVTGYIVEVYGDDNLLMTADKLTGNYLLDKTYEEVYIKVYIKYDLLDGKGEQTLEISKIRAESLTITSGGLYA